MFNAQPTGTVISRRFARRCSRNSEEKRLWNWHGNITVEVKRAVYGSGGGGGGGGGGGSCCWQ